MNWNAGGGGSRVGRRALDTLAGLGIRVAINLNIKDEPAALGASLVAAAFAHIDDWPPLLAGWTGMLGLIFTLHFGLFHLLSCAWRTAGVDAPPIMRAPIAASSLAEFWGERWNIAFADAARRFLLRPFARRWGVRHAGLLVFLVSGLAHETVISLPAGGGWGGPTLYFLLNAAGIGLEKTAAGVRLGLGCGIRGRLWMLLFTGGLLPLLFPAAFVLNVIVPFHRSLATLVS